MSVTPTFDVRDLDYFPPRPVPAHPPAPVEPLPGFRVTGLDGETWNEQPAVARAA